MLVQVHTGRSPTCCHADETPHHENEIILSHHPLLSILSPLVMLAYPLTPSPLYFKRFAGGSIVPIGWAVPSELVNALVLQGETSCAKSLTITGEAPVPWTNGGHRPMWWRVPHERGFTGCQLEPLTASLSLSRVLRLALFRPYRL